MNLPKIIFRNSWLYDGALKRGKEFKRPSKEIFEKHIKALEKQWKAHGKKILMELSKITGLKWHEKEVVIYVSFRVRPYSDPLTLNLRSDIHTLTHELTHRILSEYENWHEIKKNWFKLMTKYKKEKQVTKTHIVIHAIHESLIRNLFNSKVLVKEKAKVPDKNYIRSWDIVEKEGYENIIKELRNKVK